MCRDMDYVWRGWSMWRAILVDEKKYVTYVMQVWWAFAGKREMWCKENVWQ